MMLKMAAKHSSKRNHVGFMWIFAQLPHIML